LTTELAVRWASLPPQADRRYWASRLENIRRFARHLLSSEPKTQVPPGHLFGPAYRRNPPHLYSSGEIQQLLRRARQLKGRLRPQTFQTLLGLLVCTGLRISEALNLKTSDVDLEQLVVVVRENHFNPESPLLPNRFGQRLTRAGAAYQLHQLVQRASVNMSALKRPHISPHTFRHSMAMGLLEAGIATEVIALFLGHETPKTTHLYMEASLTMKKQALEKMSPPKNKKSSFQPNEALLRFLENL
jgi:site-specific recombinase XerD